jgi:hypothetical protein
MVSNGAKLESSAPHIRAAKRYNDLVGWGAQPDMIEGESRSSGRLLYKRDENGERTIECGLWVCTVQSKTISGSPVMVITASVTGWGACALTGMMPAMRHRVIPIKKKRLCPGMMKPPYTCLNSV